MHLRDSGIMNKILEKLTDKEKRELLESTKAQIEVEAKNNAKNQSSRFLNKDRICTFFAFVCSLGLWAFVDIAPWVVLSSVFWAPFAFYKLNPVSVIKISKKKYAFINSSGEDITQACNEHVPALIAIFPVCWVLVGLLCTTDFYKSFINYFPEDLNLLFAIAPGYILFFGYVFISGIPLSALNASFVHGFHNPLPTSKQNAVVKNNPMTFSSISASDTRRFHSPSYSHHASNSYNWTTRK